MFGKLVGGAETLTDLEKIEVDNKDRPIEDVVIQKVHVFVNPYEEVDEQLALERAEALAKKAQEQQEEANRKAPKKKEAKLTVFREGIGKYLNKEATKVDLKNTPSTSTAGSSSTAVLMEEPSSKKSKRYDFGGFKSW